MYSYNSVVRAQLIFKKIGSGIVSKVDHEKYGEASDILDLIWLLSQKAPVYSLERKRTAAENVNPCD